MFKPLSRVLVGCLSAIVFASFSSLALAASYSPQQVPDKATLYQMIQQLQQQVVQLQAQKSAASSSNPGEVEQLQRKISQQQAQINALATQLENRHASKSKTQVGSYFQFDYNLLEGKGGAPDNKIVDLHRFVINLSHQFSSRMRMYSEVEIEHVVTSSDPGDVGEVEVEQAFLEYDVNNQLTLRGGVVLVPVGILNETHEPPTYYGVERNPVERFVIPTTYYTGGLGLTYRLQGGWSIDALLHEGFEYDPFAPANFAVAEGHQEASEATFNNPAFTARVKYAGIPGFQWAATWEYQDDITQQSGDGAGSANLLETHIVWQRGQFGVKALAAYWKLKGPGPEQFGADKQFGWYVEPSWKLNPQWGVFARYSLWNNQAGSGTPGLLLDPGNTEKSQYDVGVNWWPLPNVVVKADYQFQDNKNGMEQNGVNFGLGYQF